jgi:hypothetical protein
MENPQINLSVRKAPEDIKILFDKDRELDKAALIPFQPDVFTANLTYFLLFICVGLPLILEVNYQFFSPDTWILTTETMALLVLMIYYRVRVYKNMNKLYRSGEARNGIFMTKNYLVIRKKNTCHVFPRSSVADIRSAWVSSGEDSMEKGIKITYRVAGKEKEYELAEEYYGQDKPEDISDFLNKWLSKGISKKGLINDLALA